MWIWKKQNNNHHRLLTANQLWTLAPWNTLQRRSWTRSSYTNRRHHQTRPKRRKRHRARKRVNSQTTAEPSTSKNKSRHKHNPHKLRLPRQMRLLLRNLRTRTPPQLQHHRNHRTPKTRFSDRHKRVLAHLARHSLLRKRHRHEPCSAA